VTHALRSAHPAKTHRLAQGRTQPLANGLKPGAAI
jgi:hypothetical protein